MKRFLISVFIMAMALGCSRGSSTAGQLMSIIDTGVLGYAGSEVLTTSGTSAATTGTYTGYVRVLCTTASAHIFTAASPTALATHPIAGIDQPLYLYLPSAVKVAAIQVSGAGSCSVTGLTFN